MPYSTENLYPDVMATSSMATNHKRRDLQITTVSSTSSCDHDQEKSTQEDTCWEQTAASSQSHASKDVCTIGMNTARSKRQGLAFCCRFLLFVVCTFSHLSLALLVF